MQHALGSFSQSSDIHDILDAMEHFTSVMVMPFGSAVPLEYTPTGVIVDPDGSWGRDWLITGRLKYPAEAGRFRLSSDKVALTLNSQTGKGEYGDP